jgi:predicted AAA+ superfamily ATPase
LILRGARQVGKTTVNTFAKNFRQYIYLNLENPVDKILSTIRRDIDLLVQAHISNKRQNAPRQT